MIKVIDKWVIDTDGKQYYFRQDDGRVYSRDSGKYMLFDQAIDEFCGRLSND